MIPDCKTVLSVGNETKSNGVLKTHIDTNYTLLLNYIARVVMVRRFNFYCVPTY